MHNRKTAWLKLKEIYNKKPFVSCQMFIDDIGQVYGWETVVYMTEKYEAYLKKKDFKTRRHFENMLRILFTKEIRLLDAETKKATEASNIETLTYRPEPSRRRRQNYDIF